MTIREAPSEEERRRIRRIILLDYISIGIAAFIIVLTALALIYGRGGILVLEVVMTLGALMNMCLAVRAGLSNLRIAAVGALVLAAICVGGFIYLVLYR